MEVLCTMFDCFEKKENGAFSPRTDGETPSPATSSPGRKRLATYLVPLFLIGALLCIGAARPPAVNRATHPGTRPLTRERLASSVHMSRQQVVAQAQPAVALIITADCQDTPQRFGSGEIIDPRGYIVTNYHVVAGLPRYYVALFDNSLLPARLTGIDPTDDLAVLKIDTTRHLPVMSIGNSSRLQVGDSAVAIGYPIANQIGLVGGSTATSGSISALGRVMPTFNGGIIIDAVQTDAELNAGNSGGALVNMQAQLVGIPTEAPTYINPNQPVTTANPAVKGIGFAIPANRIKFIVPQLIQYGRVLHGGHTTLLAVFVSVTPVLAALDHLTVTSGAYISNVQEGGPAALAGLQTGDVIVRVNDTPITNMLDLTDALMTSEAGTSITLEVVRGTQQVYFHATPQQLMLNVQTTPVPQCSPSSSPAPVIGKG